MEHIIDHVTISVKDYDRSKKFYQAALAPLGIELVKEFGTAGGFGRGGKPEFWIGSKPDEQSKTIAPIHVCFGAKNRAEVEAFYQAALAAGAKDNGAPGVRAHYHPNYYGAFVLDPDGHNIEAVFHGG